MLNKKQIQVIKERGDDLGYEICNYDLEQMKEQYFHLLLRWVRYGDVHALDAMIHAVFALPSIGGAQDDY